MSMVGFSCAVLTTWEASLKCVPQNNEKTAIDSAQVSFTLVSKSMIPGAALHDGLVINEAFSGGPAGLLYGFIIVWAGTAAVFTSLSELASMYAYMDTTPLFLTSAGHLPLEVSIIGSPCSRLLLRKSCSAMSQVRSNRCDEVFWSLISHRLAHRVGMAG